MPFENELKYVLDPSLSEEVFSGWERFDIRQGYLNDGPRIREIDGKYLFTYKRWIEAKADNLEIETEISALDFEQLWACAERRLTKTRFVQHSDQIEWCVDFFKCDSGRTYFVMAEAEMPEGISVPESLPTVIDQSLIHTVERGDMRFSSKNLYDPVAVHSLMEEFPR